MRLPSLLSELVARPSPRPTRSANKPTAGRARKTSGILLPAEGPWRPGAVKSRRECDRATKRENHASHVLPPQRHLNAPAGCPFEVPAALGSCARSRVLLARLRTRRRSRLPPACFQFPDNCTTSLPAPRVVRAKPCGYPRSQHARAGVVSWGRP